MRTHQLQGILLLARADRKHLAIWREGQAVDDSRQIEDGLHLLMRGRQPALPCSASINRHNTALSADREQTAEMRVYGECLGTSAIVVLEALHTTVGH